MTAIFIFLAIALLAFTCAPLLNVRQAVTIENGESARRRAALEQEKLNNLQALRDIEFEWTIGKLSDTDHRQLNDLYTRQAAAAIKALDNLARNGEDSTDDNG